MASEQITAPNAPGIGVPAQGTPTSRNMEAGKSMQIHRMLNGPTRLGMRTIPGKDRHVGDNRHDSATIALDRIDQIGPTEDMEVEKPKTSTGHTAKGERPTQTPHRSLAPPQCSQAHPRRRG